ncbi:hypothetical protein Metlim_0037 [Methanoplanus limicola DSM 2279]|uniref:Uncharacterized protein n=1 Tax=Methanoplanus limicola DSM 2279 TaxID=937775 RepID=H1YY95_9EURY|nr:hypothetical protein Metlim_0037 [Methanoplanus limicola DSM 2279]
MTSKIFEVKITVIFYSMNGKIHLSFFSKTKKVIHESAGPQIMNETVHCFIGDELIHKIHRI